MFYDIITINLQRILTDCRIMGIKGEFKMLKKVITLGLVIASISFVGSAKSLRKNEVRKNGRTKVVTKKSTASKKVEKELNSQEYADV